MANLCSLQKDPNRPGEYTQGSVDQLLDILTNYILQGLEKYEETQNVTTIRLYIAKALQEIGNSYVNTQVGPISRIVEKFFDEFEEGAYKNFLPDQGVYNSIFFIHYNFLKFYIINYFNYQQLFHRIANN